MALINVNDFLTLSVLSNNRSTSQILKVRSISDSKEYALKIIKRSNFQEHLIDLQEIYNLAKIKDHAHIIKFLSFSTAHYSRNGKKEYTLKILLPLMKQNLKEKILERAINFKYFSSKEIFGLIKKILSAFDYLHNCCKVAHRDIKPENILLDENEEIFISDFSDSFLQTDIRLIGKTIVGSPYYMAPELKRIYVDHELEFNGYDSYKADIFSLGMTLIDICTLSIGEKRPIKEKLKKITSIYGKELSSLIEMMIEERAENRKDICELTKMLKKMELNVKREEINKIGAKKESGINKQEFEKIHHHLMKFLEENERNLKTVSINYFLFLMLFLGNH